MCIGLWLDGWMDEWMYTCTLVPDVRLRTATQAMQATQANQPSQRTGQVGLHVCVSAGVGRASMQQRLLQKLISAGLGWAELPKLADIFPVTLPWPFCVFGPPNRQILGDSIGPTFAGHFPTTNVLARGNHERQEIVGDGFPRLYLSNIPDQVVGHVVGVFSPVQAAIY